MKKIKIIKMKMNKKYNPIKKMTKMLKKKKIIKRMIMMMKFPMKMKIIFMFINLITIFPSILNILKIALKII